MDYSLMVVYMSAPTKNPIFTDIVTGLLRYTTDWFINQTATIAGPIEIALHRRQPVDKPGGGRDFQDVVIPLQTFRFINQTVSNGINYSSNDDGMVRRDDYILIGSYDADIQPNDWWKDPYRQYKVEGLLPANGYETRAAVVVFTGNPDYGS